MVDGNCGNPLLLPVKGTNWERMEMEVVVVVVVVVLIVLVAGLVLVVVVVVVDAANLPPRRQATESTTNQQSTSNNNNNNKFSCEDPPVCPSPVRVSCLFVPFSCLGGKFLRFQCLHSHSSC